MKGREDLILTLTQQLNNEPLVMGFVLVGSVAREQNDIYSSDKFSDTEAYIIVKDEDVEKIERELVSIIKKLGKVIFSYKNRWSGFSTVFDDLFRLELPVVRLSEIPAVFSRPKAQPVKVLIDKTEGKLNEALEETPDTIDFADIFQKEVDDFWYMSVVASQYYKRGELYNTTSALHITVSSIIKLFEMLQDPKILLLESNKRIETFLSDQQLALLRELTPSYDRRTIEDALRRSFDIFLATAREASKKYDYDYDVEQGEEIKEKLLALLNS